MHGMRSNVHFNPRSRMGSDSWDSCQCPRRNLNFNPRSRMGSDSEILMIIRPKYISIHAPAWGATVIPFIKTLAINISIHAPAWGATIVLPGCPASVLYFNPRSRMGSDYSICVIGIQFKISIHAPAWGATGGYVCCPQYVPAFQSTLPHGERQHPCFRAIGVDNFNPRSRMGSDLRNVCESL